MPTCASAQRKGGCAGEAFLFRQGETTSTIYLIKSGKLKLIQTSADGREAILDICGPGEVLGELSLYREQTHPSSAVAVEESCVCCFSKQQFEALIRQDPSFALRIIGYLGQKRYENMQKLREETRQTVREKLLHLFYRFASEYGMAREREMIINLKITQQELADMLGSSRVAVAKALKELKAANIIGMENRYYVLKEDPCLAIHEFE